MKIILGSSSSGRKMVMEELGKELGFDFDVMIPDIDEKTIRLDNPRELVMAIAHAKTETNFFEIRMDSGFSPAFLPSPPAGRIRFLPFCRLINDKTKNSSQQLNVPLLLKCCIMLSL